MKREGVTEASLSTLSLVIGSVLLMAAIAPRACAEEWRARADIPHHVYGHASATIDGKIHVLGGCHTEDWQKPCATHQVYDPVADAWTIAADLPRAVAWSMPAVLDGKLYLFGGGYAKEGVGLCATDEVWVYDPDADCWSDAPKMPNRRMNGCAVPVGDYIYICLGYDRQGGKDVDVLQEYVSTYRYDPGAGAYTRMADAPRTGCYIAAGAHGGRVYAVSGAEHEATPMADRRLIADGVLTYDPDRDRWTPLPAARIMPRVFYLTQCSASVVHDGKLHVVGGRGTAGRTTVTSYFDIAASGFVTGADLPGGRCCGGGAVASGFLVVGGGFLGSVGNPASVTWALDLRTAAR